MKSKLTIYTVLLFLILSTVDAKSQSKEIRCVGMETLSSEYLDSDTIKISLTNNQPEMLYIGLSIEQKCEFGWEEVVKDVFSKGEERHAAKNTKLLLGEETKTLSLPVDTLKTRISELGAVYRFKVEIRDHPIKVKEKIYSTEFLLK